MSDFAEDTNVPTNDCISRRSAIDAVMETEPYLGTENIVYQRTDDVIANINKLPSAQQWIPCSERLPKEKDAGILKKLGTSKRSEYVLATVEVKGERMTVTACTYDGEWDWNMKYAFPDYKIIAWKPLPEPYKEEQK